MVLHIYTLALAILSMRSIVDSSIVLVSALIGTFIKISSLWWTGLHFE